MSGQPTSYRMDAKANFYASIPQLLSNIRHGMLGLGNCHTVARDDYALSTLQEFDGLLNCC